jgi:hypothetical protein
MPLGGVHRPIGVGQQAVRIGAIGRKQATPMLTSNRNMPSGRLKGGARRAQ